MKGMYGYGGTNVPGAKASEKYHSGYVGNTTKSTGPTGPVGIKTKPDRKKGRGNEPSNVAAKLRYKM